MEQAEKRKELRADTGLSREDRRAKAKELTDAINAKLKTVLTPDQLEKYQKMSMQRRRQQPPATPPQPAPQQ